MGGFCDSFVIFSVFVTYLLTLCYGEDILGCGGFVKSDLDINFSQVEVKLYTKQGSLKDHTDCAPNSGYYFLPFYDKGEYILKIEPPSGWSFEPREVVLNIDGTTDPCSLGKDINFAFKGFAVRGQVVSHGRQEGPRNVKVSLSPSTPSGPQSKHEVFTEELGKFLFTPVLPGKYTIKLEHPRWQFSKSNVDVEVKSGNTVIQGNALVVAGYDVSGKVTSDDEPIRDASFVLYQLNKTPSPLVLQGCEKPTGDALCHVSSDAEGNFLFPVVPPGQYRVVPHYEGPQSLQFDVQPKEMVLTVEHDSVRIVAPFQVTGFSVTGRVLASVTGHGLQGATVFMDGKISAQSRADGSFHLENMRAGSYKIQVQATDMKFDEITVKINPNNPRLADIVPSAFKVCGKVLPYQIQQGSLERGSKTVILTKDGSSSPPVVLETKPNSGEFCQMLEPGRYEARVEVTESEKNKGLRFFPAVVVITVKDRPILMGIEFSQLKVKLSGQISCLVPPCPHVTIQLKSVPSDNVERTTVAINGAYVFDDILPGKYEVSISKDDFCWETLSHSIQIDSGQSTVPIFKQNGFAITFISSHETQVKYTMDKQVADQPPLTGMFSVKQGVSKSCVMAAGEYEFTPVGCHGYSQESFRWNSANSSYPVKLTAISHMTGGKVVSPDSVDDIYVAVKSSADNKIRSRVGPLKHDAKDGKFMYNFVLLVLEGEHLTFEPTASLLLFEPNVLSIVGGGDCFENALQFTAEKGKIIEGKMVPVWSGITVTITDSDGKVVGITETDGTGSFRVGPLPGRADYSVSAEKDGHVITGPDSKGNFKVRKLAQVDVEVTDNADSKPLQGVLLSISGGESFRRNSQTNANGKMTFSSLTPGEYYLRPMMKEYRFEPPSRMITVSEGATVAVKLAGHRVAFSAYGTVTSLNGEPEEALMVEAVGQGNCSQQQEETTTELGGQFRIRGLQPKCEYLVRVKQGTNVNEHIQRGTPDGISLKVTGDVRHLQLVAFQRVPSMDVSAQVTASSPDFLRTVRVKLCREDTPDSPLHVSKLEQVVGKTSNRAMILFPGIPRDNKAYFVQLESTLSRSTHSFNNFVVHFRGNSSFKHVELSFEPRQKQTDQDLGQSSYLALVILGMLVLGYVNHDKVVPFLTRLATGNSGGGGGAVKNEAVERDVEVVSVESVSSTVVKRKVKPRKA